MTPYIGSIPPPPSGLAVESMEPTATQTGVSGGGVSLRKFRKNVHRKCNLKWPVENVYIKPFTCKKCRFVDKHSNTGIQSTVYIDSINNVLYFLHTYWLSVFNCVIVHAALFWPIQRRSHVQLSSVLSYLKIGIRV